MIRNRSDPRVLAALPDAELLEAVQRQTFGFFWDGAHPESGLARDRTTRERQPTDDLVAIGGSGFGVMTIIVAVERGWITRAAAVERLSRMLGLLTRATCHHGAFPHFMNGRSGATVPFDHHDDGGDLVETSFLLMGLLCTREYFNAGTADERSLRDSIQGLWHDVEWNWYTRAGRDVLYWHWSPNHGWAIDLEIRGWNECLIVYLLAAGAPRNGVGAAAYHHGFAGGNEFVNGNSYYGSDLPLGPALGGPLFFAHYSFSVIDPRGLTDRYADYWRQNTHHVRINHAYCSANPLRHAGYGANCWGLTASDDPRGYDAHSPTSDNGTISPTAALSSIPYAPHHSLGAIRHLLEEYGTRVWGEYGFIDAFCESQNWFAETYLAIDQGPIILMIENFRTGLLWRLFMQAPEIKMGLRSLDFSIPQR